MLEFRYDSDDDEEQREDYQQRKRWKKQQKYSKSDYVGKPESVYEAVDQEQIREAEERQRRAATAGGSAFVGDGGYFGGGKGFNKQVFIPSDVSANTALSTKDFPQASDQAWVKNNKEYSDQFPTMGGRGRRAQKRDN